MKKSKSKILDFKKVSVVELNSKSMLEINGGSEETTDVTISFVNPRNPLTTSLCKTMDAQIPMNWFKYHIELNNFSKYNVN